MKIKGDISQKINSALAELNFEKIQNYYQDTDWHIQILDKNSQKTIFKIPTSDDLREIAFNVAKNVIDTFNGPPPFKTPIVYFAGGFRATLGDLKKGDLTLKIEFIADSTTKLLRVTE